MFYDSEWDMTESVMEIQGLAVKSAKQAITEQKEEVLIAWKTVYLLEKEVEDFGILALEDKLPELKRRKAPYYEYLEKLYFLW